MTADHTQLEAGSARFRPMSCHDEILMLLGKHAIDLLPSVEMSPSVSVFEWDRVRNGNVLDEAERNLNGMSSDCGEDEGKKTVTLFMAVPESAPHMAKPFGNNHGQGPSARLRNGRGGHGRRSSCGDGPFRD